MTITLPWPPSLAKYSGEVIRAYRAAVSGVVGRERARRGFDVPIEADVQVMPPTRRGTVLEHVASPVLDALLHAGVYLHATQIDRLNVHHGRIIKDGCVIVTIKPMATDNTGWRAALGDE